MSTALVELLHDIDDRAGDARALVVIAGRQAAFMDQHDDGLDAARLQFGNQRVHRLGLVAEFEAGGALRRDDVRRAFQVSPMKATGMPSNVPDLIGGKHGLAGRLLDRAGGEIVKLRAQERMRPLAFVDRMAAAILHPQQFVLALVELVIADGGNIQPHHRQRLDGGLVVEHRRQERAGADQIAGRDEDRVLVAVAQFLDQRCHVFGAAGRRRRSFWSCPRDRRSGSRPAAGADCRENR